MNDKKNIKEDSKINILDEVKRVERFTRQQLLVKAITDLKKEAKRIAGIKYRTKLMLEKIGVGEADIKRVIDFVNELPEAKLTDSDKKEIKERVDSNVKDSRDFVAKKIEDSPIQMNEPKWAGIRNPLADNYIADGYVHDNVRYLCNEDNTKMTFKDSCGSTLDLKV